jgi:hypothetical protein
MHIILRSLKVVFLIYRVNYKNGDSYTAQIMSLHAVLTILFCFFRIYIFITRLSKHFRIFVNNSIFNIALPHFVSFLYEVLAL